MKYFERNKLSNKISGHHEVIPISNDNQSEYIKELLSLIYLKDDLKRTLAFLSNRISELEKDNTTEEIENELIKQFEENKVNYGTSDLTGGYIDDDFDSVFQCMVVVIKKLGIKVKD